MVNIISSKIIKPRFIKPSQRQAYVWIIAALCIGLILAFPTLSIFWQALDLPSSRSSSEAVSGIYSLTSFLIHMLPIYGLNSFFLLLGVGTLTLIIGISTAWMVSMIAIPSRRILEFGLILPLAIPSYLVGWIYADISKGIEGIPNIRNLAGAIFVLSLTLYPYVYLLARAAFLQQSKQLFDAGRVLGQSSFTCFWRLALPVARPAIAIGTILALLEALNDIGVSEHYGVRSLTVGIFERWLGLGDDVGAARLAISMLVVTLLLITLERLSRPSLIFSAHNQHNQTSPSSAKQKGANCPRYKAVAYLQVSRVKGIMLAFVCFLPIFFGFILPVFALVSGFFQRKEIIEWQNYVEPAFNSLKLALIAGLAAVILSLILVYAYRLHKGGWILSFILRFAGSGYAMPGAVIAVGLLTPLALIDHGIANLYQALSDNRLQSALLLSGSGFILIYAYLVRFIAPALGSIEQSMQKISTHLDDAARIGGLSANKSLYKIHIPLSKGGIATGALLVFVDVMKELPATLLLRPFGFETLATYIYQYASDESFIKAIPGGLIIVLIGLIPVWLLIKRK